MKNLSFIALLTLSLVAVSCGNKNDSGGSSKHVSSDPLKVGSYSGTINPNTYMITIGNESFYPAQQNIQLISLALQTSYNQGIQMNSAGLLKAEIHGSRLVNQQYQGGYQQPYGQQGMGNQFNVTQIVIKKW